MQTPGFTPQPALTVITPCLNARRTIADTLLGVTLLAALMRQQGLILEHLVIDGGSVDGTLSLLDCYRQQHDFCRLILGGGGGPYMAMNTGLAAAQGYYSHILNADDLIWDVHEYVALLRHGLEHQSRILLGPIVYFKRPSWRVRASWHVKPLPLATSSLMQQLRSGLHYPHPGFIAQTQFYRDTGFDLSYSYSADYKLMQTLLLASDSVKQIATTAKPIVAMAEGGLTSGWRSILAGSFQLNAINRELGIHAPAWRRYFSKAVMRTFQRGRPRFRPESHPG